MFNLYYSFRFVLIFLLLLLTTSVQASLFSSNTSRYLRAEQAFILSVQQTREQVTLHWDIAENYYLYKDRVVVKLSEGQRFPLDFPPAKLHEDEFLGETEIYRKNLTLVIPQTLYAQSSSLVIEYQGCTQGFCYPPEQQTIQLKYATEKAVSQAQGGLLTTQSSELAQYLQHNSWAFLGFFLLGLGLAFTPCVLPMLPLLSVLVMGSQHRSHSWQAFKLTFAYIQGMALTYTLLGLLVVAIGLPFQIALQSPYVLIGLSLLFVILALSMFGLFTLQLPLTLQNKLNQLSQKQQGGALGGVFVMGMISGLVLSPCTSVPLSGALLYVAQTGNLWIGGISLYLLALGMGLPLVLITLFGNKILPKSGSWLENVKIAFGFVMLALPIFLVSRLLPEVWEWRLWSVLFTAFLIWLSLQMSRTLWGKWGASVIILLAVLSSKPWLDGVWTFLPETSFAQKAVITPKASQPHFETVTTFVQLTEKVSHFSGITMVDLYADWCVACKEFEKYTFRDPFIQQQFRTMQLLRMDFTQNTPENNAVMKQYQILGLPTILFFDEQGQEIPQSRITGFLNVTEFKTYLHNIQSTFKPNHE